MPIRIAGASGLVTNEQRDALRAWVALRRPITDTPVIEHATTVTVVIAGTVRFFDGYNDGTNQIAARDAARAYVNALPMGDDIDSPVGDEAGIKAAIYAAVPGRVRDVDLSTGDVTVGAGAVAVPNTTGLTWA